MMMINWRRYGDLDELDSVEIFESHQIKEINEELLKFRIFL